MSTFVIVHGGWGGGWEWSPVAGLLRERGHEVFTPTLTGMGDRAHVGVHDHVGLGTHIDDIVALIEFENLRDVVLCGASYGGVPVTGAADRVRQRLALLVYVDALVPYAGQSGLDLLPAAFGRMVRDGVAKHGRHWRVPIPPDLLAALLPAGSLAEPVRADYVARLRDQPAATFTEPLHLTRTVDQVRRAFVRCTAGVLPVEISDDPIESGAHRARVEGWIYRELQVPHDPQLFDACLTATVLDELASAVSAGGSLL